jgi:hypothetical protein
MEPITLTDRFQNALLLDYPEFEIVSLKVNETDKVLTIVAKAKENFINPIGHVLYLNFDKRLITSWLKFTDFQFYCEMIINGDAVEPEGNSVASVENIIGTKGNGVSGSM